jgi:hypothetical protein
MSNDSKLNRITESHAVYIVAAQQMQDTGVDSNGFQA